MTSETDREKVRKQHAKFATGQAERSVIVPIGRALPARQRVLTDSQVRGILASTDLIAVTACDCRSTEKRCGAPTDVCIVVGDMARRSQGNPVYRPIGVEEALSILDRTSELGLVHMSLWAPGHVPEALCSCCRCCCAQLRAMSEFGYSDYVVKSDFVAHLDPDACVGCGVCADRCQFGAIGMAGGRAVHDRERCFGCGSCVAKCPSGALTLSAR